MSRQDQWLVTAQVDGVDIGVCMEHTGGEVTSESSSIRPGGMLERVALGGSVEYGDITLVKFYDSRMSELERTFMRMVGNGDMTVIIQQLDRNKNPVGPRKTAGGILGGVTPPESDANSSDANTIEFVCQVDRWT